MLRAEIRSLKAGGVTVLADTTLSLGPGEVKCLVAPNGLGKTTLLRALANPSVRHARAILDADGVGPEDVPAYRKLVYFMPGEGRSLHAGETVRRHLEWTEKLWGAGPSFADVAGKFALGSVLDRRARALSRGMRQQLELAMAFVAHARYTLLDEPTNALEPSRVKTFEHMVKHVSGAGGGVLVASHDLDAVVPLCTSLILVRGQRLEEHAVGDAEEVRNLYRSVYGAADVSDDRRRGLHELVSGRTRP